MILKIHTTYFKMMKNKFCNLLQLKSNALSSHFNN